MTSAHAQWPIVVAACLLAGAMLLTGCGYHAGFLIPADVRSVHVRVAVNETFWREAVKTDHLETDQPLPAPRPAYTMEIDLTERLKNEIVRRTPLKIVSEDAADTVLSASITDVKPNVLLRDASDDVLAQRVTIRVDFAWTDRHTGRVLARGKGIARPTDSLTVRGEGLTSASRKSFDHIAERIVEQMQEGF